MLQRSKIPAMTQPMLRRSIGRQRTRQDTENDAFGSLPLGDEHTAPLIALCIVANLVHAAICLRYFFLAPVVCDPAVAVWLTLAWTTARHVA